MTQWSEGILTVAENKKQFVKCIKGLPYFRNVKITCLVCAVLRSVGFVFS